MNLSKEISRNILPFEHKTTYVEKRKEVKYSKGFWQEKIMMK